MVGMPNVLWLRQEAFRLVELARACPDTHVRRRLQRLAEECCAVSMELESAMARAEGMPSMNLSWPVSGRIPVTGHH